jgi:hypothetical protein
MSEKTLRASEYSPQRPRAVVLQPKKKIKFHHEGREAHEV